MVSSEFMKPNMFTPEQNLAEVFPQTIQPFWCKEVIQGHFEGLEKISIAYAYVVHPEPIGEIVICSGRIETLLKYKELIYDLYQQGYSVFIHDHRGQGVSGRMTDNAHMGYVQHFDDYVCDFKLFVDQVVTPNSSHKPHLLCHSMGGAIGFLTISAFPGMFNKVVFCAPMFGICPALPNWLEKLLLSLHFSIHKKIAYFIGQKNYVNHPFEENELTHSQTRYELFRQEYEEAPSTKLGGVTGDWLQAALDAMNSIEDLASNLSIPALVIQAGQDQVVDNKRQTKVANKMANTRLQVIQGAKHELLMEQDQYRNLCLTTIVDFLL